MTPLNHAAQALTESLNTSSINGDLATFAVIAVLKAVREPSEEMLDALAGSSWRRSDGTASSLLLNMREAQARKWRQGIDTIINEGTAK